MFVGDRDLVDFFLDYSVRPLQIARGGNPGPFSTLIKYEQFLDEGWGSWRPTQKWFSVGDGGGEGAGGYTYA